MHQECARLSLYHTELLYAKQKMLSSAAEKPRDTDYDPKKKKKKKKKKISTQTAMSVARELILLPVFEPATVKSN